MPTERLPPAGNEMHVDHHLEPGRVDQARRFHDRREQLVAQRRRLVGQERRRVDRHAHEIETGALQRREVVVVEGLAPFRKGQDRRPARPSGPRRGHVVQMSRLMPRFIEKLAAWPAAPARPAQAAASGDSEQCLDHRQSIGAIGASGRTRRNYLSGRIAEKESAMADHGERDALCRRALRRADADSATG